ncbi:MAG: hypothetical protein M1834_003639 [Cirrosporium novae-zelandiae]|nr:MAG: hypothetical protein M1834_003639 [Cirrosporium novae-zelandiae]
MPRKQLRLLALDGGGIRGLSSLMILEQLMQTIDSYSPPKPCDYFDMIGGTSTGGLIAIMLGRLKMDIDECIKAYTSLSDMTFKGNIQGRFHSKELVQAVKGILREKNLSEDALLKDPDGTCKVFVCAASKETKEIVCLASYFSPRGGSDLLETTKIWEACRATSAASSFFDPIAIGPYQEQFIDGGLRANNPVQEVWNQAQTLWGPEKLESNIKCLVSIGTGVPSLKPFRDDVFRIGETLVAIATDIEHTAERFRQDKSRLDNDGHYYRFNVSRGLEDIGLEESKKRKEIAAATRNYIQSQEVLSRWERSEIVWWKKNLLIFDNVDRENQQQDVDPEAYDVSKYFPWSDHESILIISRLSKLEQLGDSKKVTKVNKDQARERFSNRYNKSIDLAESEELLDLLGGLQLALAQAAAYMEESAISFSKYMRFYKEQWKGPMFYLNSKRGRDLWDGLFVVACEDDIVVQTHLTKWLQGIPTDEIEFIKAMWLLRNHSMVEEMEGLTSYAIHPVVHQWALNMQNENQKTALAQLAVIIFGLAAPSHYAREFWILQRRLLGHAQRCSQWLLTNMLNESDGKTDTTDDIGMKPEYREVILDTINGFGILYNDQSKPVLCTPMK